MKTRNAAKLKNKKAETAKKSGNVDPASVRWDQNSTKRDSDLTVFRAMAFDILHQTKSRKGPLRVLSFPGDRWLWEQNLDSTFDEHKFKFTGLERNTVVHRRSAKLCGGLPARYRLMPKTSLIEYLQSPEGRKSEFDIVYLDWMGTWSRDKKKDLAALLEGKCSVAVGGLLLLTLSLRRGYPETISELEDLSYDLPLTFYDARGNDRYVSNLKVRGIPHWVQLEAEKSYGVKMRPIMAHIYYSRCGKGQTQPQLQLLFLREK